MFRSLVLAALLAGLAASGVLTLTQTRWVTPLILHAEVFEEAATRHAGTVPAEPPSERAWTPADPGERLLATSVGNGVMGIGYALLLVGLFAWRRPVGAAEGLAFGLAGFAAFFAAPSLGLPPELPGTEAAELSARQAWWLATAVGTAVGLGLCFLQTRWLWRSLGLGLLILPHVLGAPEPVVAGGLAPESLQTQFRLATLLSNALFWALLGWLSALAVRRFCPEA